MYIRKSQLYLFGAAGGAQAREGCLAALPTAADDDDARPHLGQAERCGLADTRSGSCDDAGLAG